MTYQTFAPPYAPLAPFADAPTTKMIAAKFGDGYSQDTPDGLNAEQRDVDLTFTPLSISQMQAMEAFFEANEGTPIYYALPTDNINRLWYCTRRAPTRNGTYYDFLVSLTQAFPLGG